MRILALLAVLSLAHWHDKVQAQPANMDAAKREGRVVVYGTVLPQAINDPHRNFEKKYDIKVEYWRGSSTQIADRALTEWRADRPTFDVVEGGLLVQLIMKREGVFARYVPSSSEKFPEQFRDKDGLLTPWRLLPISILYNTELVKVGEVPEFFDDLLDPKWKKKIGMPDPSQHTTTAQFLWNLEKFKGEKWRDFVKALAKQEPHLVASFAPVPNLILRGEAHVGITYIKYVTQHKGPMSYVRMSKYLTDSNYLALSAKAPHPNAARLYIEYACSAEGQRSVAKEGEFVLYPGVFPAIRDAERVAPNMIIMDAPTEEEFKKLSAEFQQIFLGR